MTKNDLINSLIIETEFSRKEASELVNTFFETMKDKIQEDGKLKFPKFGSFEVYHKNERIGRNPKTLKEAKILERNVIKFKGSSFLKDSINQ